MAPGPAPGPDPELVRRGLELQARLPRSPPSRWLPRWMQPNHRSPRAQRRLDRATTAADATDLAVEGGLWGALIGAAAVVIWLFRRDRRR